MRAKRRVPYSEKRGEGGNTSEGRNSSNRGKKKRSMKIREGPYQSLLNHYGGVEEVDLNAGEKKRGNIQEGEGEEKIGGSRFFVEARIYLSDGGQYKAAKKRCGGGVPPRLGQGEEKDYNICKRKREFIISFRNLRSFVNARRQGEKRGRTSRFSIAREK